MFTLQASQVLRQQIFNSAAVKSNVITKNNCMLGMGNGQSNRLESLRISMRKAGDEVKGASLASDAFFLIAWNDTVEKVCEVSIGVVAEHGGSIRKRTP
jgi:phosphoribosylaminoimidazolecarboxamide formyltransferase/IMP cyclohydrolase